MTSILVSIAIGAALVSILTPLFELLLLWLVVRDEMEWETQFKE